jgi:hypothetical protein
VSCLNATPFTSITIGSIIIYLQVFKGKFLSNHKHGPGVMKLASGDRFECTYVKDVLHGSVKYIFKNSDTIEGTLFKFAPTGKALFKCRAGELELDWEAGPHSMRCVHGYTGTTTIHAMVAQCAGKDLVEQANNTRNTARALMPNYRDRQHISGSTGIRFKLDHIPHSRVCQAPHCFLASMVRHSHV